MQTVLVTGAAGGIGTRLRQLLKGVYRELRLSDIKPPRDLARGRDLRRAPISPTWPRSSAPSPASTASCISAGFSVEGPWETILQANIIGCYNLFEAARRHGVERVVFASSNHAVGFYPRQRRIGVDDPGAAGFPLWRQQGVRRSARARSTPTSTGCASPAFASAMSATSRSTGAGCRSGSRRRISCSSSASASSTPTSATRSSSARRTMRAAGGTTARPSGSAIGRKAAPRITARHALAADAKLPPDPVGDWYQGGPYCSDEFDGGIERAPV